MSTSHPGDPAPIAQQQGSARTVPWTLGDVVLSLLLGTVLGIVVAGLTTAFILAPVQMPDSVAFMIIALEIYASVGVMVWLLVVLRREASPLDLGFRKVRASALLLMAPLTLGVLWVNLQVSQLTAALFGDVPTARDQLAIRGRLTIVDLVCLLVVAAVAAPIVEELVFRGLLYRWLDRRAGVGIAMVVSALTFSLVHFIPLLIGVFFAFGVILAQVARHYDSLYPAIVLHSLNNAAAVGLMFAVQ